jgi:hypothetical protein
MASLTPFFSNNVSPFKPSLLCLRTPFKPSLLWLRTPFKPSLLCLRTPFKPSLLCLRTPFKHIILNHIQSSLLPLQWPLDCFENVAMVWRAFSDRVAMVWRAFSDRVAMVWRAFSDRVATHKQLSLFSIVDMDSRYFNFSLCMSIWTTVILVYSFSQTIRAKDISRQ